MALGPMWSAKFETLYVDTGSAFHNVRAAHAFYQERFAIARFGLNRKPGFG